MSFFNYHKVRFQPRPALRHKKIFTIDTKDDILRHMSQCLYQDALDGCLPPLISSKILSRATYLPNVLYGGKLLSAFNMVRGHTPSITGLPSSLVSSQLR